MQIWVVIPRTEFQKLITKLREVYPHVTARTARLQECDTFYSNKDMLPSPSMLKAWNIRFTILIQKPGDLMVCKRIQ